MLLPNSKRLSPPFVAARLLFVELAAALPVYFEHTGRGGMSPDSRSLPLVLHWSV